MSFLKRFVCLFSSVTLTQHADSGATVPIIPAPEDSARHKQLSHRDQSPAPLQPSVPPAKSRSLDTTGDPVLRERRHKEKKTARRIQETASGEHRIISAEWLTQWSAFLRGGMRPGPVNNAKLRDRKGGLKKGKVLGVDYALVAKELADYLVSVYGGDQALDPDLSQDCPTPRVDLPVLPPELRPKEAKISPWSGEPPLEIILDESHSEDSSAHTLDKSTTLASSSTALGKKSTLDSSPEESVKGVKGLAGLDNQGLCCYLNSALQCLLSLKAFRDWALQERESKRRISFAVGTVTRGIFESAPFAVISPLPVVDQMQRRFPGTKMHDAVEFIVYLLSHLDKEHLPKHRVKSLGDSWSLFQATHSALVAQTFAGVLRSDVTCSSCGHVSSTLDPFTQLDLPLAKSVSNALDEFIQREPLSPAYVCPGCGRVQGSSRKISLQRCPPALIITLKRFQSHPQPEKLNQYVTFHKKLDLGKYSAGPSHTYQLQSVLVHSGDLEAGHYVAYCKRSHSWYLFNDALVQGVKLKEVLLQQAYVLLYSLES